MISILRYLGRRVLSSVTYFDMHQNNKDDKWIEGSRDEVCDNINYNIDVWYIGVHCEILSTSLLLNINKILEKNNGGYDLSRCPLSPHISSSVWFLNAHPYLGSELPSLILFLAYDLYLHTSYSPVFLITHIFLTNSISEYPWIRDVINLSTGPFQGPYSIWWNLPAQAPTALSVSHWKGLACRDTSSQCRRNCNVHTKASILACTVEDGLVCGFCFTLYLDQAFDLSLFQRLYRNLYRVQLVSTRPSQTNHDIFV